jgi:hypothetical protein
MDTQPETAERDYLVEFELGRQRYCEQNGAYPDMCIVSPITLDHIRNEIVRGTPYTAVPGVNELMLSGCRLVADPYPEDFSFNFAREALINSASYGIPPRPWRDASLESLTLHWDDHRRAYEEIARPQLHVDSIPRHDDTIAALNYADLERRVGIAPPQIVIDPIVRRMIDELLESPTPPERTERTMEVTVHLKKRNGWTKTMPGESGTTYSPRLTCPEPTADTTSAFGVTNHGFTRVDYRLKKP